MEIPFSRSFNSPRNGRQIVAPSTLTLSACSLALVGATVFLLTKGLRAPDSGVLIGAAIIGLAAVSVALILAVLTVDLWLIHNASAQFDSSHSALRVAHLVGSIVSVTYFGLSPVLAVAFIDTGYHTLLFDDLAWFTGIATALGWIGFFTYLPTANRKNR